MIILIVGAIFWVVYNQSQLVLPDPTDGISTSTPTNTPTSAIIAVQQTLLLQYQQENAARKLQAKFWRRLSLVEPIMGEYAGKNNHLDPILIAAKDASGSRLENLPTAYSTYLIETLESVFSPLMTSDLIGSGGFAAVQGPPAFGCALLWNGTFTGNAVPYRVAQYVQCVHTWLFSAYGKGDSIMLNRYLGHEFVKPVTILVCGPDSALESVDFLKKKLNSQKEDISFLPELRFRLVSADSLVPENLLGSYCLTGWNNFRNHLNKLERTRPDDISRASVKVTNQVVAMLKRFIRDFQSGQPGWESDRAVEAFLVGRKGKQYSPVIPMERFGSDTTWSRQNALFFRTLASNDYDELVVVDATKGLDDKKGAEKTNHHTINRVIGLRRAGKLVPAHDVVLKVRGLPGYREGISHKLDFIKEFVSYQRFSASTAAPLDFILDAGPLLMDFDKVNFPQYLHKARRKIGMFMREIQPSEGTTVFTTRVIRPTDFWTRAPVLKHISFDAQRAGIKLDHNQLFSVLDEIAQSMWMNGLSLDYADIAFMLDRHGIIVDFRIFDFERLSLGELLGVDHVILHTLIDLKTRLQKAHWEDTLAEVYSVNAAARSYPVDAVEAKLSAVELRRKWILKLLRMARTLTFLAGGRLGTSLWRNILSALIAASRIRHRSAT